MALVTFITPDGRKIQANATNGKTLMEAAVSAQVSGIDAECGGACSCATCHVHVDRAWISRVGVACPMESQMLEFEANITPLSRLSCQIEVTNELDGLVVNVVGR